jgi:hypothetical protein
VVTSLLFSLVLPLKCFSTKGLGAATCDIFPERPSGMVQILAVESPEPEASKDPVGLHAQMKTCISKAS